MSRANLRSHVFVACWLGLSAGGFAQPAAAEPVRMLCLDQEGQAVAGAEIHLFQYDGEAERYKPFGPFRSDAEGKAACDKELFTNTAGNFDRWLYARLPGMLVGAARCTKFPGGEPINADGEIRLWPSASVEGKVTVPEGFDPRMVTVRVMTLHIVTGPDFFDYQSFTREERFTGLNTALPAIFEHHPDADGHIQFDDVPVKGSLYLVTSGAGLAEAQWRNNNKVFDRPIELPIGRECITTGRALTPDGKPAVGVTVSAHLTSRSGAMYLSTFKSVTNEKGEYAIHGLPQKNFDLSVVDPKKRWVFPPMENLLGHPSTALELNLNLESGVLVTGRVSDADGKPIANAALSALSDTQNAAGLDNAVTDAEGRYKLRLPSGKAKLYFNSLPTGFAYPNPQIVKTLDITAGQRDMEKLDFTLERKGDSEK